MKSRLILAGAFLGCFLYAPLNIPSSGFEDQPMAIHLNASADTIPPTYFGMHMHRAGGTTPWPAIPLGSWRLWDAHAVWPDLEPRPGEWTFSKLDTYLTLAKEHHVEVLLPLGLSPNWASARPDELSMYGPGKAAEPRQLKDWDNYVRKVAEHCKGRVKAYEIWNEPNYNLFWTGSTEKLIELTRHAHDIIKSVDPKALIVSSSATASQNGNLWLNDYLAKGGGKCVDVIGFHFYSQTPEKMVPLITEVRQTMSHYGISSMPLWNTETGWSKPKPFPSAELAAAYLARAYLLNWAAGVQRLYWYAWDNHSFSSIETTQADDLTLTPAGNAYAMLQSWLVGVQLNSCDMSPDHTWTCTLHSAHIDKWIVWNSDHEATFLLPASWRTQSATALNAQFVQISSASITATSTPQLIVSKRH